MNHIPIITGVHYKTDCDGDAELCLAHAKAVAGDALLDPKLQTGQSQVRLIHAPEQPFCWICEETTK